MLSDLSGTGVIKAGAKTADVKLGPALKGPALKGPIRYYHFSTSLLEIKSDFILFRFFKAWFPLSKNRDNSAISV